MVMARSPEAPPQREPPPHEAVARSDGDSNDVSEHKFNEPTPARACLPKELLVRSKAAVQRHHLCSGWALAMAVLEDHQLLAHAHLRELGRAHEWPLTSALVPWSPHFMVPRPRQPAR
jgi:hypothetical protein